MVAQCTVDSVLRGVGDEACSRTGEATMKTEPYVWIVEMLVLKQWLPCADAHLTLREAKGYNGLQQQQENNPSDQFRVRRYVRAK